MYSLFVNKRQRTSKGQLKMYNPENLTKWGKQDGRQTKQILHNTICVGHHYAQTNTINVNKTRALLQTTGDKDEPNIIFIQTSQHGAQNVKTHNRTTEKTKKMSNTDPTNKTKKMSNTDPSKKPGVNAVACEG